MLKKIVIVKDSKLIICENLQLNDRVRVYKLITIRSNTLLADNIKNFTLNAFQLKSNEKSYIDSIVQKIEYQFTNMVIP